MLGIKFAASNTHVFSTSTDQRLNVWKVGLDNSEGVFLALADAAFVDVPDPSVMDVIKYKYVYLFLMNTISVSGTVYD